MQIFIPFLNYDDIKKEAEDFLDFYHPDRTIPVPIEDILELKMKIHVVAKRNLKKDHEIDAFLNSNFDILTIDDFVFNNYNKRTMFTLAHEIGHVILHKNIYQNKNFESIEEYMEFQSSISEKMYARKERQAEAFAGCLLMPSEVLREKIDQYHQSDSKMHTFNSMSKEFQVSNHALMIQIEKDQLPLDSILKKLKQEYSK